MGTCFCQTGGYKEHFACFRCRKMFRQRPYRELPEYSRPATYAEYKVNCPECNAPMQNMGREFKPPKQGQLKQWRELEMQHWQQRRAAAIMAHRRRACLLAKAK